MNGIFRIFSTGPLSVLAIMILLGLLILLIPLLILGLIGAAFSRLGFSWIEAIAVILLMLLGSFVNIPLWTFQRINREEESGKPRVFDAFTGEPVPDQRFTTTLSLNVGGAVIPFAVSVYLLYEAQRAIGDSLLLQVIIALLVIAIITKISTKIIAPIGIRAPLFLPAISAIVCGVLLSGGTGLSAAVIAFVGGTMGTLLGADILNLPRIREVNVQNVSIGGAGTFGAVFLCGLLAALIA